LLGKICRLTNRHKVAQSYHKAALTLDPLLWSAYEELCMLGESCTSYTASTDISSQCHSMLTTGATSLTLGLKMYSHTRLYNHMWLCAIKARKVVVSCMLACPLPSGEPDMLTISVCA